MLRKPWRDEQSKQSQRIVSDPLHLHTGVYGYECPSVQMKNKLDCVSHWQGKPLLQGYKVLLYTEMTFCFHFCRQTKKKTPRLSSFAKNQQSSSSSFSRRVCIDRANCRKNGDIYWMYSSSLHDCNFGATIILHTASHKVLFIWTVHSLLYCMILFIHHWWPPKSDGWKLCYLYAQCIH